MRLREKTAELVRKVPTPKPHHFPIAIFAILIVSLSVGLVATLLQKDVFSTNGNMYLSPISVPAKNAELRVVVRIMPGTKVDTVTATVSYDKNKLTYKKVEYTNSPFTTQIPAIAHDGSVTVQSAKFGGGTVDGDSLIATILFTATADSASLPTLVYGNAAYAGKATNPTINGKVANEAANPLAVSATSAQTGLSTDTAENENSPAALLVSPISSLLKQIGVSDETAEDAAPWLTGIIISIVAAGITCSGWIVYKRVREKQTAPQEVSHDSAS